MEGAVNGGTISFTIYGKETRPANRTIKYVSETLSKKDPGEPITKVDASLKPGARVKEQSAHYGLQSRLWKYVYVDGVETEKTLHRRKHRQHRSRSRHSRRAQPVRRRKQRRRWSDSLYRIIYSDGMRAEICGNMAW